MLLDPFSSGGSLSKFIDDLFKDRKNVRPVPEAELRIAANRRCCRFLRSRL
jgi:hypothetical protein